MALSIMSSAMAFAPFARSFATRSIVSMSLKEGDSVPNVVFRARVRDDKIGGSNPFAWKDVSTADLFKGKKSVIFALPGGEEPNNLKLIFFSVHWC